MTNPVTGSTVSIHYTVSLADGQLIETTKDKDPVDVIIGENQIMPTVERALLEMAVGENTTVTVPADNAYGAHDEKLVQKIPRSDLPADLSEKLQTGMGLKSTGPNGEELRLTVVELTDDSATFDANHPLAGHDLTFELELVKLA